MIHYHGTPITPNSELFLLAGRNFCVSFASPQNLDFCLRFGQAIMFDNGAFTLWTNGKPYSVDKYYRWLAPILSAPHWAIVPDVIEAGAKENDKLLKTWPYSKYTSGVVWHMDESLERLMSLVQDWPHVCFGSTSQFGRPTSDAARQRIHDAFEAIDKVCACGQVWIHGLRMMALSGGEYPFASVDSADIAINHHRDYQHVISMANRWDVLNADETRDALSAENKQMELTEAD